MISNDINNLILELSQGLKTKTIKLQTIRNLKHFRTINSIDRNKIMYDSAKSGIMKSLPAVASIATTGGFNVPAIHKSINFITSIIKTKNWSKLKDPVNIANHASNFLPGSEIMPIGKNISSNLLTASKHNRLNASRNLINKQG